MKKLIFFLFLSLFIFSSCSTVGDKKGSLKVGISKEDAIALLGKPIEGEKYCREDILFYYDGAIWFDGSITSDECFPLLFENNKLIGWGQDFYQEYKKKNW